MKYKEQKMLQAIRNGNLLAVMRLVAMGAKIDVKHPEANNKSYLHFAAHWDRPLICKYLIKKGIDVDVRDDDGWTPLHNAVKGNSLKAINALISCNATVDAENNRGETPLYYAAAACSDIKLVDALVKGGADMHKETEKTMSPFDMSGGPVRRYFYNYMQKQNSRENNPKSDSEKGK